MAQITEETVNLWEYKVANNFMRLRKFWPAQSSQVQRENITVFVHVAILISLKCKHKL